MVFIDRLYIKYTGFS